MRISSKDKILDTLIQIDDKTDSGSFNLQNTVFDQERINLLESRGYIICDSVNRYHVTELGYSMLQRWYALKATRKLDKTIEKTNSAIKDSISKLNKSSEKINREMLKQTNETLKINKAMFVHTKSMSNLTKAIIVFTIANFIFIGIQIFLMLRSK